MFRGLLILSILISVPASGCHLKLLQRVNDTSPLGVEAGIDLATLQRLDSALWLLGSQTTIVLSHANLSELSQLSGESNGTIQRWLPTLYLLQEIHHWARTGNPVTSETSHKVLGIEWEELVSLGARYRPGGEPTGIFGSPYEHAVKLFHLIKLWLSIPAQAKPYERPRIETITPWDLPTSKGALSWRERYLNLFALERVKKRTQVADQVIDWALQNERWPEKKEIPAIVGMEPNKLFGHSPYNLGSKREAFHVFYGPSSLSNTINERYGQRLESHPSERLSSLGTFAIYGRHTKNLKRWRDVEAPEVAKYATQSLIAYMERTGRLPFTRELAEITGVCHGRLTGSDGWGEGERFRAYRVLDSPAEWKALWTEALNARIQELKRSGEDEAILQRLMLIQPSQSGSGIRFERAASP